MTNPLKTKSQLRSSKNNNDDRMTNERLERKNDIMKQRKLMEVAVEE